MEEVYCGIGVVILSKLLRMHNGRQTSNTGH